MKLTLISTITRLIIIYLLCSFELSCILGITLNIKHDFNTSMLSQGQVVVPSNVQTGTVFSDKLDPTSQSFLEDEERLIHPPNVTTVNHVTTRGLLVTKSSKTFELRKASDKKIEETPSMDCVTKRGEILLKQQTSFANKHQRIISDNPPAPPGFQKLQPRLFKDNLDNVAALENEHVPQCTPNGRYEPVQCHKIGYCWCVNKYGQAIRNSATIAGEKPHCDMNLYESETNRLLVVTGVSAHRMKGLLRSPGTSNSESSSTNAHSDSEHEQSDVDQDGRGLSNTSDNDFSRRVSASPEPSLALVPYECALSRQNAIERASRHTDALSIWVPECDSEREKFYAEKQCHKSRVCWCVDQTTGLPLRTKEQLTKQTSVNCTEIKRNIDSAANFLKQNSQKPPFSFFHGFSESCPTDERISFVKMLIDQFRLQLNDYQKQNLTYSPSESFVSTNPYRLSESQVSLLKFTMMDGDADRKLDDREWNNFKRNFKLVDRLEEMHKSHKQETNTHLLMTPLNILRSQRRCWLEFIQFCSNGDVLTDQSITLLKWLSCTEIPSEANLPPDGSRVGENFGLNGPYDVPDAYTKEAAIARSRKKNPFLGILKPD